MDIPVSWAYVAAAAAALCYGASSLLLAIGARRLLSAAYLGGLLFQAGGFGFAFLARSQAPLLVVQSAVTASVAVTAVLGMLLGRWRLTRADVGSLAAVIAGVVLVGVSAEPGPATGMPTGAMIACVAATFVCLLPLLSPTLVSSAGALGALAGTAYGASAVAARAVAGTPDPMTLTRTPLWAVGLAGLIVGGVLVGQALLTVAFRRSSSLDLGQGPADAAARGPEPVVAAPPPIAAAVTGPVAAVYVASTVLPALAGLIWLGDRLRPGLWPLALAGVALALAGAVVLSRWENS